MAAPVQAQLVGLPEAQASLAAISEGVQHLAATHQAIADLIAPRAAANVPNTSGRGTGTLAASLVPVGEDQAARLESDTDYAAIIEAHYGYTQAAVDSSEGEIVALYEAGIAQVVAQHGG
jgi:tryptophanyl-tRNA synthetase